MSCCTPPSACEITACEMPAEAASAEMFWTKVLKSPPQRAAKEGVARESVASSDAQRAKTGRTKCMGSRFSRERGMEWSSLLARRPDVFEAPAHIEEARGRRSLPRKLE